MSDAGPYRTPSAPRQPFGYCPECGVPVYDKDKWLADGKKHAGCAGSVDLRLCAERDKASRHAYRLQAALDQFYSYTFTGDTAKGFFIPIHVWDELAEAYKRERYAP